MSGLLAKGAALFVAPAETVAFAPPRRRPLVAGVLAAEPDLIVAAGAVAASLRREARAAQALVGVWRGHDDEPPPAPAPGARGASRLASRLVKRGLAARACGALCVVELPADPGSAIAAFRHAAAGEDAPVVLALARRDPALDELLTGADRLVLGTSEDSDVILSELACEGLARLGPPAQRIRLPRGMLARQAARLGLVAPALPGEPSREAAVPTLEESLS